MNNLRLRVFPLIRTLSVNRLLSVSTVHTSSSLCKVHKTEKKKASQVIHHSATTDTNEYVKGALKEMTEMETILAEELSKHFSLQEHKMSLLGRVSLKNAQMVMINFADNPTAIKSAKVTLQKSALGLNPQQEGVVLYIQTPRMTRERREQLAKDAQGKILNDYKQALNEVFTRFDKKCNKESLKPDLTKKTRQELLELKKAMESRAANIVENKKKELLKEIV